MLLINAIVILILFTKEKIKKKKVLRTATLCDKQQTRNINIRRRSVSILIIRFFSFDNINLIYVVGLRLLTCITSLIICCKRHCKKSICTLVIKLYSEPTFSFYLIFIIVSSVDITRNNFSFLWVHDFEMSS